MNMIKRIARKLCYIGYCTMTIIRAIMMSIFCKNKIYLFGIPIHGNLGDQAILLAEEKFLKDNIKNVKIIEVESSIIVKCQKILKKFVGNSTILVHGGGFLGTLWINEEEMFRTILKGFPKNRIIVFPQTIYFSDNEEGKEILKVSKDIYQTHSNLTICCREQFSYKFMKENFPKCDIILIPDMVLYLQGLEKINNRSDALLCIRQDREKIIYNFDEIKEKLKEAGKIEYTDTVMINNIYTYIKRKKYVMGTIEKFAKYKIIVTDRLHGMVFALLANTPCLVLENKSYKTKGVYDWIKSVNYVQLYNENNVQEQVEQLLKMGNNHYTNEKLIDKYEPLIELIKNVNKKEE